MLSDSDINLLAFAQTAELATRDLYLSVVNRAAMSGDEQAILVLFHDHHVAYEQSLNGLLGKRAALVRDESLYAGFLVKLSNTAEIWATLLEIENILVATHTAILERLESAVAAGLIASVITVEARHAAILATLISGDLSLALDNNTQALVAP